MKGVYPKIPNHYTQELGNVLKSMLQIDPKKRPTCEKLLSHPNFDRFEENHNTDEGTINMLGTIRLPRNVSLLQVNLPESNYETDKDKDSQ